MRTTRELLIILLAQVRKTRQISFSGMCSEIRTCEGGWMGLKPIEIISFGEGLKLRNYISNNVPSGKTMRSYWWTAGVKEPRIMWLEEHIRQQFKLEM